METTGVSIFDVLIWSGAAVTLAGLALLIWCIVRVARARRGGHDEARLRETMQKTVPVNLAALFLSVLGLMMVVVGIILR